MLDHIGLRTAQFDTLLAFYKAALAPLGYTVMMEYPGAAGIGRDYPDFWIGADDKGGSNIHLAFKTDDVSGTRARLLAAGATPEGEVTVSPTGDELAMLRDPWGLPLQFLKRKVPMI